MFSWISCARSVRSVGTMMQWSTSEASAPPPFALSASVATPFFFAARRAAWMMRFDELPLVVCRMSRSPGRAQSFDLARKNMVERKIVADRGESRCVGSERDRADGAARCFIAHVVFGRQRAARRLRCRRCRRKRACRPVSPCREPSRRRARSQARATRRNRARSSTSHGGAPEDRASCVGKLRGGCRYSRGHQLRTTGDPLRIVGGGFECPGHTCVGGEKIERVQRARRLRSSAPAAAAPPMPR